jgi:hypothetical protein
VVSRTASRTKWLLYETVGDAFETVVNWAQCCLGASLWLCQDELFGSYISRLARREEFRKAFADAQNFSLSLPARQNT